MKKLSMLAFGLTLGLFLFGLPSVASAEGDQPAEEATMETVQAESEQSADAYNYVAQEGDSYSEMARKAIQTYGLETETNLSGAQIVFAETMLTQEAGSPVLNLGQSVSINKDTVKMWIEKAQELTDEQQSAWDYYVQFVDFNTNGVGEANS